MTWDLSTPTAAPAVLFDPNGNALGASPLNFRGINLTTDETANALPVQLSPRGSVLRFGASTAMPSDGNYEFSASKDGFAMPLASDPFAANFFLNGDANHSRAVDFNDYVLVNQNYGRTGMSFAQGDFNGDGAVNFNDLVVVSQRYNERLSAAPSYAGEVTADSLAETWDGKTPLRVNWAPIPDSTLDSADPANAGRQIEGYDVYRSPDGADFTKVGSFTRDLWSDDPEPSTYSYTDSTAGEGQKYWYRVRPYYETTLPNGNDAIEHLPTTNKVWRVAAILPPENVALESNRHLGMTVTWDEQSQSATDYVVEIRLQGGAWTQAGVVDAGEGSLEIPSAQLPAVPTGSAPVFEARVRAESTTTQIDSPPVASGEAAKFNPLDLIDGSLNGFTDHNIAVSPGESFTFHLTGTHANHQLQLEWGGAHSTVSPSGMFMTDGNGDADINFTGVTPGYDLYKIHDLTLDSHNYFGVVVGDNEVSIGGTGNLVEADSTPLHLTVTRGYGVAEDTSIHVDLSLVSGDGNADTDDVNLPSSVDIPSGQDSVTVNVTSKDDDKAEGVENIVVKAQPQYGPATTQGVGTIDDNVAVKSITMKFGDPSGGSDLRKVSVNGYEFLVTFVIKGEHLDRVTSGQMINSYTRVADTLANDYSRDYVLNTFGGVDPSSIAAAQVDTNDQWEQDVGYDSDTHEYFPWSGLSLAIKPDSHNGEAYSGDHHYFSLPKFQDSGAPNQPFVSFVSIVQKSMRFTLKNQVTGAQLAEHDWSYAWVNTSYAVLPSDGYSGYCASYAKQGDGSNMIVGAGIDGGFSGFPFVAKVGP